LRKYREIFLKKLMETYFAIRGIWENNLKKFAHKATNEQFPMSLQNFGLTWMRVSSVYIDIPNMGRTI